MKTTFLYFSALAVSQPLAISVDLALNNQMLTTFMSGFSSLLTVFIVNYFNNKKK